LFHGAISESADVSSIINMTTGLARTAAIAANASCSSAACLRTINATALLAAMQARITLRACLPVGTC